VTVLGEWNPESPAAPREASRGKGGRGKDMTDPQSRDWGRTAAGEPARVRLTRAEARDHRTRRGVPGRGSKLLKGFHSREREKGRKVKREDETV